MHDWLNIAADAARFWGAMGGIVMLYGWTMVRLGRIPARPGLAHTDALVVLGVGIFLILMGGSLPMLEILDRWLAAPWPYIKAVSWWLLASAGWGLTVFYTGNLRVVRFVSTGLLAACVFLSVHVNAA